MFESTEATLKKSNNASKTIETDDGKKFTVLKQFEFSHQKMTQSVIVTNTYGEVTVFVKGSAESIEKLCKQETLPRDFNASVKESARNGIYQISVGTKVISKDLAKEFDQNFDLIRDEVEKDLEFIGCVNFKNMLKEESAEVIQELKKGDIKSVMLTGDNILTGINVALECGMIDKGTVIVLGDKVLPNGEINWTDVSLHKPLVVPITALDLSTSDIVLAVTGEVWRYLLENKQEYALQISDHIRVYGRCTPYEKVSVISCFVHKGEITLMCGDGGNDCGALKMAHVGIALSDAEASIVSPFTSLDKSITSVTAVLKEGRCALASAFSTYKYMLMYGQVATINQLATAYFYTTFSDWSWVFLDGIWLVSMAFTLPLAKPAKSLSPSRPTSSLFGWNTLTSYLGVLALNVFFVAMGLTVLYRQDWFHCRWWGISDAFEIQELLPDNYETEVIFIISGFQYLISAAVFNFGFTHRDWWIKNYVFVFFFLLFGILQFYITLVPGYVSCFFRVNCDNEVRFVVIAFDENRFS